MDEFARHPKEDVCNLLQSLILKFCEEHYKFCGAVEVDAIICLSSLNSESQDVVKIHQVLQSDNKRKTPELSSSSHNAKINHSKKQRGATKQHFFKRNSYLSRYPRKQYKPIHITRDIPEMEDSLTCPSLEESIVEAKSFQNTIKSETEDILNEIVEEAYGSNSSVDYLSKIRESRLSEGLDRKSVFPNQTAKLDSTDCAAPAIKKEMVDPTEELASNFSSRPKRKQNPKRIVRLHDSQNMIENDVTNLDSESEEDFTSLIAKEDNVEEKQVMDDSGDTDEFQIAFGSSDFKAELSYPDPEGDEDLTGGPESNHQDIDAEINDSSSEHFETTPTRKSFKHKTKKISQNLRQSECKVFQCSKCGSGFSSKKSQMRHERYNCGDIPHFECNVCGKFYSRADSKTRHLWKIHGIKISTPDKNSPVEFP